MFDLPFLMVAVPALPLLAAIVIGLFGRKLLKEQSHWPTIIALGLSCLLSIGLVCRIQALAGENPGKSVEVARTLWTWAAIPDAPRAAGSTTSPAASQGLTIDVTLRADALTAMMLTMVTLISMLVAIYAVGYMHGDPGYWRFFAYVSLFVFSMTMLVSVSNFALLYVFWEAVGVCSYLLIGFWFHKPEAAAAGKKAFLVNRVGDFGFALAVFLIWLNFGTLDFQNTLSEKAAAAVPGGVLTAICLLLFVGACGKSAQFPLHVWLPDAMEGPTPVSALIHAATMVTAGVYLVTRCTPLFVAASLGLSPESPWWHNPSLVVAAIGCITAVLAGLIAVTQTDLKRVLAYSTVSQLGFMFLSLGTGTKAGVIAGMFHLFTHAFFKALLFLGAGSVMHAMGNVIDMRRFGGLRRLMPWTHATFLVGCLALSGVAPLAGFWSKDEVLAALRERADAGAATGGFEFLFWIALAAASLTAFYTFRAFFLTFYGQERVPREAGHHAHESPRVMVGPLAILAFCAIVVGALLYAADGQTGFAGFLSSTPSFAHSKLEAGRHTSHVVAASGGEHAPAAAHAGWGHLRIAGVSTLAALLGIGLAAFLYLGDRKEVAVLARWFKPLHALSHGKFFLDEMYYALLVWPLEMLARLCFWFDRRAIDGLVDSIGRIPPLIGSSLRTLQIGLVQFYALSMVLGLLVLIGMMLR